MGTICSNFVGIGFDTTWDGLEVRKISFWSGQRLAYGPSDAVTADTAIPDKDTICLELTILLESELIEQDTVDSLDFWVMIIDFNSHDVPCSVRSYVLKDYKAKIQVVDVDINQVSSENRSEPDKTTAPNVSMPKLPRLLPALRFR